MTENKFHNATPDQSNVPSHPSSRERWGATEIVKVQPEPSDDEFHNTAPNAGMLGSRSVTVTKLDESELWGSMCEGED